MVNPQEKSFDEKFSHFTRLIKPRTSIYKTYLKLKTDSINFPPGLKLKKTNEINFPATEKHIKDYIKSGKLYFESEIEALDPYSAAIVAKSKFGTTLDLIRFVVQKPITIDVDKRCLVIHGNQGKLYKTDPDLGGFLADKIDKLPNYESQLNKIMNSDRISHSSKDKLKGALRYFRLRIGRSNY